MQKKWVSKILLINRAAIVLSIFCSMSLIGNIYATPQQNPSQETQQSHDKLLKEAESGNPTAQFSLGRMYWNNQGVKKNYAEARKWFQRAADQEHAGAQIILGIMYENGQGVKQDYAEAVRWFRKAADQGDASAQFNLGLTYERGRGVKQDYAEAVKWYKKSADQGDASAQLNLGFFYKYGEGVRQDYAEAIKLFRKAADQGDALAQFNLGFMHARGRGVKKSYAEGIRWLKKAANQGMMEARQALETQSYKDSPVEEEILKAKTRAAFEKILLKLSFINPFDNHRGEIIDAAMKIPLSKRITVFHFVQKSSIKPFNNKNYFDIYADVPVEEIEGLFKAASVFFSPDTTDYDRQGILRAFKSLKKEKRIKMSQYIKSIISEPQYLSSIIEAIISIPEEEVPDIIARTQIILGRVGEEGTPDLIYALRRISKEKRDFIMEEAQKLHQEEGKALGKVFIIESLMKLGKDDFRQIVDLSQQLFFKDTHGGHRSTILKSLSTVKKDERSNFITQVKPLLKEEDDSQTRINVIRVFSKLSEPERVKFLQYIPSLLSRKGKEELFQKLDSFCFSEDNKLSHIINHLSQNLCSEEKDETKLLVITLSAIQKLKLENAAKKRNEGQL